MSAYTNVAKPVGNIYTNVEAQLANYDESTLTFDDANTFYDGVNQAAYTKVAKPVGSSYINVVKPIT